MSRPVSRPGFFEGVAVAAAASVIGTVAHAVLVPLAGAAGLRALIALLALAYVLYLQRRSGARVGRVTALAAWSGAAVLLWWLAPSLPAYLLAHLALIWLLRALQFHDGLLSALADLGLTAFAFCAALWAMRETGSVGLAIWCLFLVQALFVAIPPRAPRPAAGGADRFEHAWRAAEAAARKLAGR